MTEPLPDDHTVESTPKRPTRLERLGLLVAMASGVLGVALSIGSLVTSASSSSTARQALDYQREQSDSNLANRVVAIDYGYALLVQNFGPLPVQNVQFVIRPEPQSQIAADADGPPPSPSPGDVTLAVGAVPPCSQVDLTSQYNDTLARLGRPGVAIRPFLFYIDLNGETWSRQLGAQPHRVYPPSGLVPGVTATQMRSAHLEGCF